MRGTATPLRDGPFSLSMPGTAGPLPVPNVAGGGSVSSDLMPWIVNMDTIMTPYAQTNWSTVSTEANSAYRALRTSSGAQNDEISWKVPLAVGTYTFELVHSTNADTGIYTLQFDGVSQGTIDGYSAGATYNVRSQIASISVGAAAVITLKLLMATKNASSSNYYGRINHWQIKRTA